ncbi:MAG: phosphoribosylaminoimidazolesuccinocarboxamide synthase [Syntrophothermus sp.]|nr:phosphoribosylaminoimidazolesuccinocarboxamide synthase [Ignavibacteriaceae bacterium]
MNELDFSFIEYPDYILTETSTKIKSKNLGEKFALIQSFFMDYLKEYHIPVNLIRLEGTNSLKIQQHQRFPFYIKILNVVDKRTAKLFSKKEGEVLTLPIIEYHYLQPNNSLISESHIISFDLSSVEDLKVMNRICSKVNAVLKSFFERRDLQLAEFVCCFGKKGNKVMLVDDFTPKSIKAIPVNGNNGDNIDPYKLNNAQSLKKYTDLLYNLMSL